MCVIVVATDCNIALVGLDNRVVQLAYSRA